MHVREILLIVLIANLAAPLAVRATHAQQAPPASPPGAATLAPNAQAQNAQAPNAHVPNAPVGHRQPTMNDLPPDLANKERSGLIGQPNDGESTSGQGQSEHPPNR